MKNKEQETISIDLKTFLVPAAILLAGLIGPRTNKYWERIQFILLASP